MVLRPPAPLAPHRQPRRRPRALLRFHPTEQHSPGRQSARRAGGVQEDEFGLFCEAGG
jgi:hypothetical protein